MDSSLALAVLTNGFFAMSEETAAEFMVACREA
jgi:hypothetical protein